MFTPTFAIPNTMGRFDDLSEHQLFMAAKEGFMAAKKAQEPPVNSAAHSAALLNSARIASAIPSSLSRTSVVPEESNLPRTAAAGQSDGKLKRPSFVREDLAKRPKRNLAKRGDPYELIPSPEKAPVKDPKTSVQKAAKKLNMPVVHEVSQGSGTPSPPSYRIAEGKQIRKDEPSMPPRTSSRLAGDTVSLSGIDFSKVPEHTPKSRKWKSPNRQVDPGRQSKSPRASRNNADVVHATKGQTAISVRGHQAKSVHPQVLIFQKKADERGRSATEVATEMPSRKETDYDTTKEQTSDSRQEEVLPDPSKPSQSARKLPEQGTETQKPQNPKTRKVRNLKPSRAGNGLDIASDMEENTTVRPTSSRGAERDPEAVEAAQPLHLKKRKPKEAKNLSSRDAELHKEKEQEPENQEPENQEPQTKRKRGRPPKSSENPGDANVTAHQEEDSEAPSQIQWTRSMAKEASNASPNRPKSSFLNRTKAGNDHNVNAQLSNIAKVFRFLEAGRPKGKCKTDDAVKINKACEAACELISLPNETLEEVSATTNDLRSMLAKYGGQSKEDQRKRLHADAYFYLFRKLVAYLETLHALLRDTFPDFEQSVDAMRIIAPYVSSVISFHDLITDWKIECSGQSKIGQLVKDTDADLLIPLRKMEHHYRTKLIEMIEEKKRKNEGKKRKKLVFWIDLHVRRLQVEHDPYIRRSLAMKPEYFDEQMRELDGEEVEESQERDANGVPFERVDIFKKRVAPPARRSAFIDEKEWTDEQMSALVEGLTQFAGPYVFHSIFDEYCRYGRPLRRFGVPEITAKAGEIRSRLLARYQEQEWEDLPEWIEKIPILP